MASSLKIEANETIQKCRKINFLHNFSNQYHIWSRRYFDVPQMSGKEFLQKLTSSKLTGRTPQYANFTRVDKNTMKAQSRCHYDFKYDEGEKKLKLVFRTTSKDQQTLEKETQYDLKLSVSDIFKGYYDDRYKDDEIDTNESYHFPNDSSFSEDTFTKVGDRTFSVYFNFNSAGDIHSWSIVEMICTATENGRCTHATSLESDHAQGCHTQETFHLEQGAAGQDSTL